MTDETQKSPNTQEKTEPKEEKKPEGTKLAIFFSLIRRKHLLDISIKTITDKGEVDSSRDDEIQVSINPESEMCFADSSKSQKVKLVNGQTDFKIRSGEMCEVAIFTAKWVSGKSPLQNIKVSYLTGSVA